MDEKDRRLMLKLARKVTVLESDVKLLKKASKGSKLVQLAPALTTQSVPECVVISRFVVKDVNTIPEQNKAQEELRAVITEFCRGAGIEELNIHFKEHDLNSQNTPA